MWGQFANKKCDNLIVQLCHMVAHFFIRLLMGVLLGLFNLVKSLLLKRKCWTKSEQVGVIGIIFVNANVTTIVTSQLQRDFVFPPSCAVCPAHINEDDTVSHSSSKAGCQNGLSHHKKARCKSR